MNPTYQTKLLVKEVNAWVRSAFGNVCMIGQGCQILVLHEVKVQYFLRQGQGQEKGNGGIAF